MARFALIVLVVATVGGLIWGIHPERIPPIGWILLVVCAIYGLFSVFLPERMLRTCLKKKNAQIP